MHVLFITGVVMYYAWFFVFQFNAFKKTLQGKSFTKKIGICLTLFVTMPTIVGILSISWIVSVPLIILFMLALVKDYREDINKK